MTVDAGGGWLIFKVPPAELAVPVRPRAFGATFDRQQTNDYH